MADRVLVLVGWVGTVLVALAVGRLAALDPRWDAYMRWAGMAGVICVFVYVALIRRDRAAQSHPVSAGSRLHFTTVVSACAAVVLVAIVASRLSVRWDVTPGHVYRIAPETRAAIRQLDASVRMLVFAGQAEFPGYRDRLQEYSEASRLVDIQYVDVEGQPALAKQYEVRQVGTAVVEYKGRNELIKASSEQEFTNALVRLREGRTRKVYFTSGHAERDTDSGERVGYNSIAAALQRENFVVQKFNLARDGGFPSDATVAVVAGPRADFFRAEIESLQSYLSRGGALLLMIDPFEDMKRYITESGIALFMMDPSSVSATGELRNLTAFIRDQGAELGNDVIVDNSQMGKYLNTDASVPVVSSYPHHPITQTMTSLTAYPMARSVKGVAAEGRTVTPILESGTETWAESDIRQLASGHPTMDAESGDRPGPIPLGVAVSARSGQAGSASRETRLVIVGDSDFVANYSANIPGNAEMFLSVVRWLAQEKLVAIPPRTPEARVLAMTGMQVRLISLFAVLVLPALIVGAGMYFRKSGGG